VNELSARIRYGYALTFVSVPMPCLDGLSSTRIYSLVALRLMNSDRGRWWGEGAFVPLRLSARPADGWSFTVHDEVEGHRNEWRCDDMTARKPVARIMIPTGALRLYLALLDYKPKLQVARGQGSSI